MQSSTVARAAQAASFAAALRMAVVVASPEALKSPMCFST
jgi:hypothetical protein